MNSIAYATSIGGDTIKVGDIEGSTDSLIQIRGRVLRVNEFTSFLIQEVIAGKSAAETAASVNTKALFSSRVSEAQIEALITREIFPLFQKNVVGRDNLSYIRCKIVLLKFEQIRFILQILEPLFRPIIFFGFFALGTLITAWFLLFGDPLPVKTNFTINYFVVSVACVFGISLLHEFGHAAAALRNKIEPAEIGTGLYFWLPVFYADVSETWRLLPRKRLIVNLAGVYMQFFVNIALIIFLLLVDAGRHHDFIGQIVMVNTFSIGLNLIPFLKLDGYWLLADLLNMPNLQRSSSDYLRSIILWPTKKWNERPELNLPLLCYAIGQVIFVLTMTGAMVIFLKNGFIELMNISSGELSFAAAIRNNAERYTLFILFACIFFAKIYGVLSKLWKKITK